MKKERKAGRRYMRKLRSYSAEKKKSSKVFKLGASVIILSLVIAISSYLITKRNILNDFYINYVEQYNLIANGRPNYCSPYNFDIDAIFMPIESELLNQEEAVKLMKEKFRSKKDFLSFAIVGSSGIGKSKFSSLLRDHFWWPENVYEHVWLSYQTDEENEQNVRDYMSHFKHCGQNLLIIDDLSIEQIDFVNAFNLELHEYISNSANLSLNIIYIFNLSRYSANEDTFESNLEIYKREINSDISLIRFRTFNETDLMKCIAKHAKELNVTLRDEQYDEISKGINVKSAGCKNVVAKVLFYK